MPTHMDSPPAPVLTILADDREARGGVIDCLRARPGIEVIQRRLPRADYVIPGRLLVERKTLADFVQSVIDGRLFQQALRLRGAGPPALLILEGPALQPLVLGISRASLLGAMVTLSVVYGIPVLRTADACETAATLVFAAEQLARQVRAAVPRPGYRPKGLRRRQLFMLQGLPGIGPQRAEALLDTFGTLAAIATADVPSLAAVPGLGPKTITRLHELLTTRTSP